MMAEAPHFQPKTIIYTVYNVRVCVCVLLQHICSSFYLFFSNFWLILSTSPHFLLRGAVQSSHVERSCDKAGEKWGREEEKKAAGGGEGKTEGKERLRSKLGVRCDQGSRDDITAIKDGDVQRW